LREDLDIDWDSVDHQRMTAQLAQATVPLHELEHRIIRKAAEDFPVGVDADVKRESISGLTDPMWWKAKIGARWRGAVYVDDGGQAWLCAAGYRREGEGSDFYKRFMATIAANGPAQYLPAQEDFDLLDAELKEMRFAAWESEVQSLAVTWAIECRESGLASYTLNGPSGGPLAEVNLAFDEATVDGEGEGLADLYVEFACLDWSAVELLEWAESVVLTCIDDREQDWQVSHIKDGRAYSLTLTSSEVDRLFDRMAEPHVPGVCVPGHTAHYAHTARLVQSTIEGEAVKALCGKWFVPRQDHESLEPCAKCEVIIRSLPA
jgi:hypothetical protein